MSLNSIFYKTYDDLLEALLRDYKNLDPSPDITEGSIVFIKAAVLSSCLWGLYRYQDYLAKQIFPDSCETDSLNHFGSIYGIPRLLDETDTAYASRIISFIQDPPAGGTANDYKEWAIQQPPIQANGPVDFHPLDVYLGSNMISVGEYWVQEDPVTFTSSGVLPSPLVVGTTYYAVPQSETTLSLRAVAGGPTIILTDIGTGVHTITSSTTKTYGVAVASVVTPPTTPAGMIDIVLVPTDRNIMLDTSIYYPACATLSRAVKARIDTLRPVTADGNGVYVATPKSVYLTMTVSPATVDLVELRSAITNYVLTLGPGETLYNSQITAIAITVGADNASVTYPAFDTYAGAYELCTLRSLTINT